MALSVGMKPFRGLQSPFPDLCVAVFVGDAQSWLPELIERAKGLKVNGGFETGTDLYEIFVIHCFNKTNRVNVEDP